MKLKRITSLLLTAALTVSLFAVPASAADSKFKKLYLSDTFSTANGANGWEAGPSQPGYEATIKVVSDTEADANYDAAAVGAKDGKALKLTMPKQNTALHEPSNYGVVTKALDKVAYFQNGKTLILETRIKKTAEDTGFFIRANRPNTLEQPADDYADAYFYNIFGYTVSDDYPGLYTIDYVSGDYVQFNNNVRWATSTSNKPEYSIVDKWVTYRVEFKPSEGKYYVTMTYTDPYGVERTFTSNRPGLMKAAKSVIDYKYGEGRYDLSTARNEYNPKNFFDTLERLSFTPSNGSAGEIYVDYIEVYEEKDFVTASVSLPNGTYIRESDSIDIKFTSESAIESLPEDAFEITGVETDYSYNAETKTVTLTPKTLLTGGGTYFVKIDANMLAEEEGMTVEGETDYTIEVSDINANNLTATGRVIPGNVITSSYVFSSSKPEGTHTYQWQMSATGEEGTFTDIDGATADTLTVTDNEYGNYLRFKMIPYALDENGENTLYGFESYSTVIAPEKKPVASNAQISTTTVFEGIYISGSYNYSDENGDSEGATVLKWYTSDTDAVDGEWTEQGEGKTYLIDSDDVGKYIKFEVTPVAVSERETMGEPAASPVVGPVVNILESTNMFVDPGFENGSLEAPWVVSNNYSGADIQTQDTHSGNYALHLAPRTALNDNFGQRLTFKTNKTYVLGAWGKKSRTRAQDVRGMTVYAGGDTLQVSVGELPTYTLNDRWQLMRFAYTFKADTTTNTGFVTWTDRTKADIYLDDLYCGELLIADIETYDIEPITVPLSGETSVAITSGRALNQLGANDGLSNETVVISIPDMQGVYVDGNKIVVTEQAKAASFTAEIYCEPQYAGAIQSKFQKFVEVEIVPHNDPTPKALNAAASGAVGNGTVLTGSYEFCQVDGKDDASEYRWIYSDTEDGEYTTIPGATATTYTVEAAYADKYIKFAVTPKTDDGLVGKEVLSNVLTGPKVPVAFDVKIIGGVSVGEEVEGAYEFDDPNDEDAEGTSLYRWLISDTENGTYTAIAGQTAKKLTLTEEMCDKYIKFEVTPVSVAAPEVGTAVVSEAGFGPSAPYLTDLQIVRDGNRLLGDYIYKHPHYLKETDTLFKWTIDGVVVSTAADYVINFTGTKTVVLSATPVCDGNPARGATVSVSATVTGNSAPTGGNVPVGGVVSGGGGGGTGGGGGGVSGGSGSGAGVTSVNDMKLPEDKIEQPSEEQKPVSDIDGHWGEEYISKMAELGVMAADENGNYQPDELVSRESMLTYLFKALGLEPTEYTDIFDDVADGEFAQMLQTMVDNGTIAVDDNFRPADSISREEMCKILYVSLNNAGKLEEASEMLIEGFADYNLISEWARIYVNGIYANGIMVGVSDTEFDAQGEVTKAQAATMLVRILALMEEAE